MGILYTSGLCPVKGAREGRDREAFLQDFRGGGGGVVRPRIAKYTILSKSQLRLTKMARFYIIGCCNIYQLDSQRIMSQFCDIINRFDIIGRCDMINCNRACSNQ